MTAEDSFQAGLDDGEEWARATGTTEADLHLVPVVKGTVDYKTGFRCGVARVRRSRYMAENGVKPADLFAEWDKKG